jgi:hypothetical protein
MAILYKNIDLRIVQTTRPEAVYIRVNAGSPDAYTPEPTVI